MACRVSKLKISSLIALDFTSIPNADPLVEPICIWETIETGLQCFDVEVLKMRSVQPSEAVSCEAPFPNWRLPQAIRCQDYQAPLKANIAQGSRKRCTNKDETKHLQEASVLQVKKQRLKSLKMAVQPKYRLALRDVYSSLVLRL